MNKMFSIFLKIIKNCNNKNIETSGMIQHVTHSTESLKTDIKVNKSLIWAHNNPFWGYI